jgi:putative acetyltransferase
VSEPFKLRRYTDADEAETVALWLAAFQPVHTEVDFSERHEALRVRWRNEIAPANIVTLATMDGRILGFITLKPDAGYIDQFAVAPDNWGMGVGATLLDEAKRLSPVTLDLYVMQRNCRAIRFYEKHGFVKTAEGFNERMQLPTFIMRWQPV